MSFVCVCERERERGRERKKETEMLSTTLEGKICVRKDRVMFYIIKPQKFVFVLILFYFLI